MASFTVGKPVTTSTPTIAVDAGLAAGAHRFQLEVIDSAGNRSLPDVAVVAVQRLVLPVPPVTPIPGPTIPLPGPLVTPILDVPRPTVVVPNVVTPRSPAPKGRSKRSKPK